jgi:hypothetical protein
MTLFEIVLDMRRRFEKEGERIMKGYNNPSTGRPREAHGGGPPEPPVCPHCQEIECECEACEGSERIEQARDAAEAKRANEGA